MIGFQRMLNLVFPDKKYLPSVYEAVKEYKKHPSKFEIHTVSRMIAATENDFADYFEKTKQAVNANINSKRIMKK